MLFPNVKNEKLSAVGLSFSSLFSPLDTFILLVKCLFSPFDSHFRILYNAADQTEKLS